MAFLSPQRSEQGVLQQFLPSDIHAVAQLLGQNLLE